MAAWSATKKAEAAQRPSGPRDYETFVPADMARWMFAPRDANAGFESWPALDELFPTSYQGINPNRGLDGTVIDMDRGALVSRMRTYLTTKSYEEAKVRFPALTERYAGYDPRRVWDSLRKAGYDEARIIPYLLFPLDCRWLYYEREHRLLNRPRPELAVNANDNEFLVTVPQPRQVSETRPLLTRVLFDLHVHDRGSIGFPRESRPGELLERTANLHREAWRILRTAWGLKGELLDAPAQRLVGDLFRCAMAIMHSPQYETDHADALAQDWAHLPIPKDKTLFAELVALGKKIGTLLDPAASSDGMVKEILGKDVVTIGVSKKRPGGQVAQQDLVVSIAYFGAARGRWINRAYAEGEAQQPAWGDSTGDLHINDEVYFANVPKAVWSYEIGGYPVLKKWLGYRQASRREGRSLTLAERQHFRSMIQRLAALLALHGVADALYERSAATAFTAEELGVRK
jgi:hypothetical protein